MKQRSAEQAEVIVSIIAYVSSALKEKQYSER